MKNTLMRMQLSKIFPTLLGSAAAIGLAGFVALTVTGRSDAKGGLADVASATAPGIPVALVVAESVVESQEFSGRLEAIDHVEIRARVSGFIDVVNFKAGTQVRKGDVLFKIDPRPYQAELTRAEAAAASASAKAELAKLELNRAEKLLVEKAIPQREYDEKASGLKELAANARAAQAAYDGARLNMEYTQVRAPIDGRVGKAEITVGNLVDNSAVLTSLVSNNEIYAEFDGDEETYQRVGGPGQRGAPVAVKIGLSHETGFPHVGKLEFVDNQLNEKTGSVRMRAIFDNKDNALAPGLFARVRVDAGKDGKSSNALLVDERAVGTDQNRKFVYVVGAGNKAEYRAVTLGPTLDGMRLVRSGLSAGERIVVNGLQRVQPGAAVMVQMVPMRSPAAVTAAQQAKPTNGKAAS